jgi:AraC-like DNA-binding protein
MALSIPAVLFLSGAIQGLILSFSIFVKSNLHARAKSMLVAFIVVISLQIILKVISKDWIGNYFGALGIIAYQFPFLFGPLSYLFIKFSIEKHAKFSIRDLLHFIPFLIPVFLILLIITIGAQWVGYFLPNSWLRGGTYVLIQLASYAYYGFLSIDLCRKYESTLKVHFSNLDKMRISWFKEFIVLSAITSSAVAVVLFLMYNLYPDYQEIRYVLLVQGILIYWVSYKALSQPAIFSFAHLDIPQSATSPSVMEVQQLNSFKKYAHNHLADEHAEQIRSKLLASMELHKLYLNQDLSIEELSKLVGESRNNVSRVINEKLNMNFFDFVNSYRISAAKAMLADSNMNKYTIAAIAFECGFSSVSSFNIVFKKTESVTPSAYKKEKHAQG